MNSGALVAMVQFPATVEEIEVHTCSLMETSLETWMDPSQVLRESSNCTTRSDSDQVRHSIVEGCR